MAAKNTAQNKSIFLYGSGFFAGAGTGLVARVSIYFFTIPYFLPQCKPIEAYKMTLKMDFFKKLLRNYSSFHKKSQFMPKNNQTEERFSCKNINIIGIVIVLMRVRSDQSLQKISEIPKFPPPSEIRNCDSIILNRTDNHIFTERKITKNISQDAHHGS
jgi:hypothetical protein